MEATLQSPFGQTVPEPGVVETFPDPAGTGKVSYEVTISNVTDHGITFTVLLTRGGTTYHLLISGLQVDDGVQIQLPDTSGNQQLQTENEAQFAVAGSVLFQRSTGEVLVWIHFTY